MDKGQELINQMKAIDIQSQELLEKKIQLKEEYLNNHTEFKIGEKVRVHHGWKEPFRVEEVFIKGVHLGRYGAGYDENYKFAKIKKDGTPSKNTASIYNVRKIERV